MPELAKIIKESDVKILSSKGVYLSEACNNLPTQCKVKAFLWLFKHAKSRLLLELGSLLVIGDSDCEIQAGSQVSKQLGLSFKSERILAGSPSGQAKQILAVRHRLADTCRF